MRSLLLFALAGLLGACDTGVQLDQYEVVPGDILLRGEQAARVDIAGRAVSGAGLPILDEPIVEGAVPVRVGEPFEVTVWTFGGLPTCTRAALSEVTVDGLGAHVAVRDSVLRGDCVLVLAYHPRTDVVVLTQRGKAVVTVLGRRLDPETLEFVPHEIRFPVVVE